MAGKSVQRETHDHNLLFPKARPQKEVDDLSDDGEDGEQIATKEDEEGALGNAEIHLLCLPPAKPVGGTAACGVEARLDVFQEAEGAKPLESVEEREEKGPNHLKKTRTGEEKEYEAEEEE